MSKKKKKTDGANDAVEQATMNDAPINENAEETAQTAENAVEATADNTEQATQTAAEADAQTTAEADAQITAEADEATEQAEEKPAPKKSAHNTAAAAAFNAAGEETDVRRLSGEKRERKIKTNKISYERKKHLYGYGFIALWLVGTIWLFISPVIKSLGYSLTDAMIYTKEDAFAVGYTVPGIHGPWNNFANYVQAFRGDPTFPKALVESIGEIIPQAFVIMIFSLFIAIILNQKFRGRTLARAIFFLPVLIATGPIITVINGDMASQGISGAAQFSTLFKTDLVSDLLEFVGIYNINPKFTTFIEDITSNVLNLVWNSGIQILIFLSALQNIPPSAKEAANMEGATSWEFFWKITFPMISPMILANLVYTVIDAFVATDNQVMQYVLTMQRYGEYGFSAAMAWVYFAVIGGILGIIVLIVNRFVFYENE